MTAVTARVAGVTTVVVASPRPARITIAAAHVAGADALLAVGGAHAIAAMAHGVGAVPKCDVIVGPGNRWVTAAKALLGGVVGIDMLAGPSECLVLADATADPRLVAADLLAQAEHDTDALPVLVTTHAELVPAVDAQLSLQLRALATRDTAVVSARKVRARRGAGAGAQVTCAPSPCVVCSVENSWSSSNTSCHGPLAAPPPISLAGFRRRVRDDGRGDPRRRHACARAPGGAGRGRGRGVEAHRELRRDVHRRKLGRGAVAVWWL